MQDYKVDEDPAIFKSVKTGRGPLGIENFFLNMPPASACIQESEFVNNETARRP